MVQMRGLMYVGFALAVLVTWFINRRRNARANNPINKEDALKTPETIDEALKHPRWTVRMEALESLQNSDDVEALSYLIKMLHDPVNDIRQAAINAIVRYGNQALGGLITVMDTGGLNAREACVKTLCDIGTPETVDLLITALQDESAWVRIHAVQGLSAVGGDRARQALEGARTDEHPDVVKAVLNALQNDKGVAAS